MSMRIALVYPKWDKIPEQTEFHLPPHGPVCVAAAIPEQYEVRFTDENVDSLDLDWKPDVVLLSMMLTCQLPRGKEIAAEYRRRGVSVISGGIATMLHAEEIAEHVDSVFLGEVENGRLAGVLEDCRHGKLQALYNYFHDFPPIESVGPARREILNQSRYIYRGVKMVDLVHASRGCRFNCFPCATAYLGGRQFRPRPLDRVAEELAGIDNNRLFMVDNSLAQDKDWVLELFAAMKPLKKKWISHPILDDDEVLAAAADAGCWYVYQAVFDTSEVIRNRVRRLKEHGIGVEAAVLLGPDNQDADYIKRLVDFLLEIDVEMAEFSILTPFPHTPVTTKFEQEGRILHRDWRRYTTAEVCFQPKQMTPDELQEMYDYAWRTFYQELPQPLRMARLFSEVVKKEMEDGTYVPHRQAAERQWQAARN
ncbi:B12-binding domain-containing radical SAM protein [Desulfurivibrio dismutans]|uniref:B12-binding domain-containing radical SAM protein n=1 Tax=Desulfurivibrio dismutans TaxID=1398908 RepID=UPI0023D9F3EC|nr:cobalamin-dependent protein [Desulfurivibrio alkaliphilus]MDF1614724.1 cobalamin-dependent protein [Desulfurivibrio alkaliphilus]